MAREESSVMFSLSHLQALALGNGPRLSPGGMLAMEPPYAMSLAPVAAPPLLVPRRASFPRWVLSAFIGLGVLLLVFMILAIAVALRPPAVRLAAPAVAAQPLQTGLVVPLAPAPAPRAAIPLAAQPPAADTTTVAATEQRAPGASAAEKQASPSKAAKRARKLSKAKRGQRGKLASAARRAQTGKLAKRTSSKKRRGLRVAKASSAAKARHSQRAGASDELDAILAAGSRRR
jgi:hypothetical protein